MCMLLHAEGPTAVYAPACRRACCCVCSCMQKMLLLCMLLQGAWRRSCCCMVLHAGEPAAVHAPACRRSCCCVCSCMEEMLLHAGDRAAVHAPACRRSCCCACAYTSSSTLVVNKTDLTGFTALKPQPMMTIGCKLVALPYLLICSSPLQVPRSGAAVSRH